MVGRLTLKILRREDHQLIQRLERGGDTVNQRQHRKSAERKQEHKKHHIAKLGTRKLACLRFGDIRTRRNQLIQEFFHTHVPVFLNSFAMMLRVPIISRNSTTDSADA